MNEELAVVLGLVIAVIGIVLAYTFMVQGTDSTIKSMEFLDKYDGDRNIQNQDWEVPESTEPEAVKWQKESLSQQEWL